MNGRILGWWAMALLAAAGCGAHDGTHGVLDAAAPPNPRPIRVVAGAGGAVNPWSHLAFRNDPDAFQFAIVADRAGGARPGVFEDALRKLNLLQPEFVVSVGDLIEGYSEDVGEVRAQWDELQSFVRALEVPFFYVAGNHDFSNPVMAGIWRERFGRSYYSFVYRDVLFLCLNSQEPALHHLGAEQAQWVRETLAAHTDVRWTLVFLHTPLWEEFPAERGWGPVEEALKGRDYTVFAGHFHTYMKRVRHDQRYYVLATTGGASSLRGPAYGEFDHVVWVTMTDTGPIVANLMLEGIWDDSIRTPESEELARVLADMSAFVSDILWQPAGAPVPTSAELRCANPLEVPLEIAFAVSPGSAVSVELQQRFPRGADGRSTLVVQPGTTQALDFRLGVAELHPHQALAAATIQWEARFQQPGKPPGNLRGSSSVAVVPRLVLPRVVRSTVVDGAIGDWPGDNLLAVTDTAHINPGLETWSGPGDCSFRLGVSRDEAWLYAVVDVVDDSVGARHDLPPWQQDGVEVRIDARPATVRHRSRVGEEGLIFIAMSPGPAGEPGWAHDPDSIPAGTRYVCTRNDRGYTLEVALPLEAIRRQAGADWEADGVRVNVAVNDNDNDGRGQAQLWWQPDWRGAGNIRGSGTFFGK